MMNARPAISTSVWIKAVLLLECIWVLAGAAVYAVRALQPTVPEVTAYIRQQDIKQFSAEQRTRATREVAQRLSGFTFAQLEQVRVERGLSYFYQPLTPAEKEQWAELIVPLTVHRLLEASRALPLPRRMGFITESLFNHELDWLMTKPALDPDAYGRIRQDAIRSYLDGLHAAERLQMEQLWERQRNLGRETK